MTENAIARKGLSETKKYKAYTNARTYVRSDGFAIEYTVLSTKEHNDFNGANLAERKSRMRDASTMAYVTRPHVEVQESVHQVKQVDTHFNSTFVWGVLIVALGVVTICLNLIASSDLLSVVGSIMLGVGLIMVALFVMDDERPTSNI